MLKVGAKPKLMRQVFSEWGGAVSGKLGQRTTDGFEVIEAGVRIFEKKSKEAVAEVVPTSA